MSWLSKLVGGGKPSPRTVAASAATAAGKATSLPPPLVRIDRHNYLPCEFALGSFRIHPYDGDLIARQQFDFRLSFEMDEVHVEFACRGLVTKLDNESGLIARFQQPQPFYERKLMMYLRKWKGGE